MSLANKLLSEGQGVLRLAPTWVPRSFCRPGKLNQWALETPALIRYGQLTNDEYFVTEAAAKEGVTITNTSATEPIVMLKHFAENPELKL